VGLTLPRSLLAIALAGAGFAAGFVLAPRHGDRGAVSGLPVVEHVQRVSLTGLSQVGRLPRLVVVAHGTETGASTTQSKSTSAPTSKSPPLTQSPPHKSKPTPTNTNTSPTPPPFQPHSGTGG
jgi:hypothetical protein